MVELIRESRAIIGRRQVPDTAMLALAPAYLDVADDIAIDIASPDVQRTRDIAASVRSCIVSFSTDGIRGDASSIDAITDETSRGICTRQLPIVDLVHLVAAVVQGVEQGLRGLLIAGIAPRRAPDELSAARRVADVPVRITAQTRHVDEGESSARALLSGRAEPVIGKRTAANSPPPMTPDYEDP